MSPALALVSDLEARGLALVWGQRGLSLRGDLGKLTPEVLAGMKAHRRELESLAQWRRLQDGAEAKFGKPCARLYPFVRLKPTEGPLVGTPLGEAYIFQVTSDGCHVLLEADATLGSEARTRRLGLDDIIPPTDSPNKDLIDLYQPYGGA